MVRARCVLACVLALAGALWPEAGPVAAAEGLTVAAAASLQPVFGELVRRFEAAGEPRVTLVLGASGSLAQQMRHGAPYDLFASADARWVRGLADDGLIDPTSLHTYALGRLALVVRPPVPLPPGEAPLDARALALLKAPQVRVVALANPAHAPYGAAAEQALRRAGLWRALAPKRVYGENVRQALRFLESGNAEAALVAVSLLADARWPWRSVQPILHAPIPQTLGIARGSPRAAAARRFTALLATPVGQALLIRHGYEVALHPPRSGL